MLFELAMKSHYGFKKMLGFLTLAIFWLVGSVFTLANATMRQHFLAAGTHTAAEVTKTMQIPADLPDEILRISLHRRFTY